MSTVAEIAAGRPSGAQSTADVVDKVNRRWLVCVLIEIHCFAVIEPVPSLNAKIEGFLFPKSFAV